jgi:hypothetical protein
MRRDKLLIAQATGALTIMLLGEHCSHSLVTVEPSCVIIRLRWLTEVILTFLNIFTPR